MLTRPQRAPRLLTHIGFDGTHNGSKPGPKVPLTVRARVKPLSNVVSAFGDRSRPVRSSKGRLNLIRVAVITIVGALFLSRPAYAYFDPGTGSLFVQLLLGGLAGLAVASKLFWSQIKAFLRNLFSKKVDQEKDFPENRGEDEEGE